MLPLSPQLCVARVTLQCARTVWPGLHCSVQGLCGQGYTAVCKDCVARVTLQCARTVWPGLHSSVQGLCGQGYTAVCKDCVARVTLQCARTWPGLHCSVLVSLPTISLFVDEAIFPIVVPGRDTPHTGVRVQEEAKG